MTGLRFSNILRAHPSKECLTLECLPHPPPREVRVRLFYASC